MEQKVWLQTSSPLYANMYVFLIGHPGTGKSRTINEARKYLFEIEDFHLAPTSLTWASLTDALVKAKRTIIRLPEPPIEYNSMLIAADELGTFMHKYDKEMSDGLSAFYYPYTYGHERRGGEIRIKIKSPQLSVLCGSTPSNLIELLPEGAWGQGFMSRVILVFSDERIVGDDFATVRSAIDPDLIHDLRLINSLVGGFTVTEEYKKAVLHWRSLGEPPTPTHPKLLHYNARRKEQLYKLSMISSIDKTNAFVLTKDDFNRALGWLVEVEALMPDIFKAVGGVGDSQAMDEAYHFMLTAGVKGVSETRIINFLRERVPAHSVLRVLEIMERSGKIKCIGISKGTGLRQYKAQVDPIED
jgi:hypothetical protein